jgi:hypothetical protein
VPVCVLVLDARKWFCRDCGCQLRQGFPGIQAWQRSSEAFQRLIFELHRDAIAAGDGGRAALPPGHLPVAAGRPAEAVAAERNAAVLVGPRSPACGASPRNNGITEVFHNKMELVKWQAYVFRNFQN